jgi:hypothetical protein
MKIKDAASWAIAFDVREALGGELLDGGMQSVHPIVNLLEELILK